MQDNRSLVLDLGLDASSTFLVWSFALHLGQNCKVYHQPLE